MHPSGAGETLVEALALLWIFVGVRAIIWARRHAVRDMA